MSRFSFFPVLEALNDGRMIRRLVAAILYVLSIATLAGGLYLLVEMLRMSFRAPTTEGTLGGLLFSLILLATLVAVAQIFWYRARTVKEISDSAFTVIPVVSVLFRTVGEMYATMASAVGVGGCLFIWLAKGDPSSMMVGSLREWLPSLTIEASFVGGLLFLLYMVVAGFVILLLSYFLAESSLVLVDVAGHIRILVRQTGPVPEEGATPPQPPAPSNRCQNCGAELAPGAYFCGSCGGQVAGVTGAGR